MSETSYLFHLIRFLFSADLDQILISWTFLELHFRLLHDNKTILFFLQISFPTLMAPYLLCSRHCVQHFCAAWKCEIKWTLKPGGFIDDDVDTAWPGYFTLLSQPSEILKWKFKIFLLAHWSWAATVAFQVADACPEIQFREGWLEINFDGDQVNIENI